PPGPPARRPRPGCRRQEVRPSAPPGAGAACSGRVGLAVASARHPAPAAPRPARAPGGEPAPAAAAGRGPPRPPAPAAPAPRPAVLDGGPSRLRRLAPSSRAGAAGDRTPVAPPRLAAVLVVALPPPHGAPARARRGPRPDRSDVAGQPPVGRRAHPR